MKTTNFFSVLNKIKIILKTLKASTQDSYLNLQKYTRYIYSLDSHSNISSHLHVCYGRTSVCIDTVADLTKLDSPVYVTPDNKSLFLVNFEI